MRKVAVLGRITFATTLVFSVWSFLSSKLYQYNKCDSLVQIVSLLEHHIMKNQVFKARIDVACNMSLEFSQYGHPQILSHTRLQWFPWFDIYWQHCRMPFENHTEGFTQEKDR